MQAVQTAPLSQSQVKESDVQVLKTVWMIGAVIGTIFGSTITVIAFIGGVI